MLEKLKKMLEEISKAKKGLKYDLFKSRKYWVLMYKEEGSYMNYIMGVKEIFDFLDKILIELDSQTGITAD